MFALVILRTRWGYDIFEWLGERVTAFLEYTTAGVVFVYGDKYYDHFFAMKVNTCARARMFSVNLGFLIASNVNDNFDCHDNQ